MEAVTSGDELRDEGIELFNERDYEAAAQKFRQALDAYAVHNRDDMVAEMKVNQGLVYRALGEHQQAIDLMESALNTFEEIEDQNRVAQVLGNLGGVYKAMGDQYHAELSYRQAANSFRDIDKMDLYVDTLMALGRLQWRSGKIFLASATYQDALQYVDKEERGVFHGVLDVMSRILARFSGSYRLTEKATE